MTKVYLAAPFFKDEQKQTLDVLEKMIEEAGLTLLSPRRRSGVLMDMPLENREEAAWKIFLNNLHDLDSSDIMLAVIDDRDTGTIWEMGFFFGLRWSSWAALASDSMVSGRKIYTFTNHEYNLNIMLAGCVAGHAKGFDQLAEMLACVKQGRDTEKFLPNLAQVF